MPRSSYSVKASVYSSLCAWVSSVRCAANHPTFADEHDLDGIFRVEAGRKWRDLRHLVAVPPEIGAHEGPIPVDLLKDYLPLGRAVENHPLVGPEFAGRFDHAPRRLNGQQGTQMGLARARFHQRAVADDQVGVAGQLLSDPARRIEPPAGDDHDFDAALGRLSDRQRIGFGEFAVTIEQRSVDIGGNEPDWQGKPPRKASTR